MPLLLNTVEKIDEYIRGLFDVDKDLIVITKLQSPILRQGTQQFAVKLDF